MVNCGPQPEQASRSTAVTRRAFFKTLGAAGAAILLNESAHGQNSPPSASDQSLQLPEAQDNMAWFDARDLGVLGRGFDDTESFYDRLPARAKDVVTEPVWSLSHDTAGMNVQFETDATSLEVRFSPRDESLAMNHMPATGVSGVDLYVYDEQQQRWRWCGLDRKGLAYPKSNYHLFANRPARMRRFMLYLPLYNGLTQLEIGVPREATLNKVAPSPDLPLCFYGTSITQGGCASRPGMAYPAIISRRLNMPHFNFGFSGNGRMHLEMARFLAELNVAIYILDSLPNMVAADITERYAAFVDILRQTHPDTPIVLIESIHYQNEHLLPNSRRTFDSNAALNVEYNKMLDKGVAGLSLVRGEDLLGHDNEATVDGTHATDLGFMRISDVLTPHIAQRLGRTL
ncbi:MAG: SGNH/GDSL hydrolase family protein [Phycisphaeraceae bacterium]|nr:SGNH/GDSL hydrolase family protein [Phycisphaeraceae bacterium]